MISGGDMARSYEEASATRRGCLPVAARSDGAVFGRTYQLAVQVMEGRQLLGLTQTELAEKTDIDQGDISRIERGSVFPTERTLLRLSDALGAE
jgi:ribosome-binding protein aMBF1 (putative translation factor)